jgi:hypothetical protein
LKDQDIDGIDAEVLYPSVLFNVYQIKNLEILKATFAAYNDWTADYCKEAPHRLFPLACLQLYDLDDAITEMERAKKLGHVGVCIPATAPPDRLYSDHWYDKFWDAAQAMQMPLTMHIFTGATPNHGLPFRQAGSPLAFAGVMFTIADLIQSGVRALPRPEVRHHRVRNGLGGHHAQAARLELHPPWGAKTFGIPLKPSAYWKRHFYVTFEDDPIGIRTRDFIGTNTLLWGNDYPHGDSVFPHSQQVLNEVLQDCTPAERYEMTVKNVVQLYNLPFEV